MIKLNKKKCTACGLCVEICHESCLSIENGWVKLDQDACSTCTQCIAICPALAITWDGIPPDPFQQERFPTTGQIEELLKQRRTIRNFTSEIPARGLIEEVIHYGVYAPTHSHTFRVIAVDDPAILSEIDRIMFRYNQLLYKYLFKPPWIKPILRLISPSQQEEFRKAKPKLESSLEMGKAYRSLPPVIIFIVGRKQIPLSQESAQYMLYSMDLYARTKGLGCRNLVGNQMFLNHSRELNQILGIGKKERMFATAGFGYPAIRFRNKVEGRTLPLAWCSI